MKDIMVIYYITIQLKNEQVHYWKQWKPKRVLERETHKRVFSNHPFFDFERRKKC